MAEGWARPFAFPWVLAAGVHWLHELRELELALCGETFAAPGRLRGCTTDAASEPTAGGTGAGDSATFAFWSPGFAAFSPHSLQKAVETF